MSRFADQLPIVTEPTAANFLLGTDENEPRALVRIPADGLGGGGSTNYKVISDEDLDLTQSISLTAGNYIFSGSTNANLDLVLEDGERLELINLTNKNLYIYSFEGWILNGVLTSVANDFGIIPGKSFIISVLSENLIFLFSQSVSMGVGPGRPGGDPHIQNVVVFLKGQGSDLSTNIIDSSVNEFPVTRFGSVRLTTSQAKYGASCINFLGNAQNYVEIAGLNIPFTNTFTIEGWYRFSIWNDSKSFFEIKPNNDSALLLATYYTQISFFAATQYFVYLTNQYFPAGSWNHIAVSCSSGILRIFVNGIKIGSDYSYANNSWNLTKIVIGKDYYNKHNEFVSHFRITKNVSRYNANFDPENDTFLNI